ncbi:MAG: DNA alkylation repair protein [Planctomycetia bacterium]|nr:DNA alkylation repair protein [Planctomycetia bacterium]
MQPITIFIKTELKRHGNTVKAPQMQAYMKTDQPFYGVQSKPRKQIFRDAIKKYPITSQENWELIILELWNGTHREEMYQALEVAERYKIYHDETAWNLFEKLLRSATNWDTVDWLSSNLIGRLVEKYRHFERQLVEWSADENFWVRRASILAHLKHKEKTNINLLSQTILKLAHEKEFFIRKAIGWVLRQYSYADSDWVLQFVKNHEDELSGLSKREALKAINRVNSN